MPNHPMFEVQRVGSGLLAGRDIPQKCKLFCVLETGVNVKLVNKRKPGNYNVYDIGSGQALASLHQRKEDKPALYLMQHADESKANCVVRLFCVEFDTPKSQIYVAKITTVRAVPEGTDLTFNYKTPHNHKKSSNEKSSNVLLVGLPHVYH